MKLTIDQYIDAAPQNGILGKYRFIEEDICLGVVGKNAKFVDYIVKAHIEDVKAHSGLDSFYVIVDIRHVLWSNKEFEQMIKAGIFRETVNAAAILAETEFSRMLGEEWIKGDFTPDTLIVVDNLDSALSWTKRKKEDALNKLMGVARSSSHSQK